MSGMFFYRKGTQINLQHTATLVYCLHKRDRITLCAGAWAGFFKGGSVKIKVCANFANHTHFKKKKQPMPFIHKLRGFGKQSLFSIDSKNHPAWFTLATISQQIIVP